MGWFVAGVIAFVGLMVFSGRFRRFGFGVIGLAVIAGAGLWLYSKQQERKNVEQSVWALETIGPALELSDVQTLDSRLFATVRNNSRYHVRGLTLRLAIHDCPNETIRVSACTVVGEDTMTSYTPIPAGQARQLDAYVSFPNMAPVRGVVRRSYKITEVKADR